MKKSMKKEIAEHICVKKRVTLGQIPNMEQWLNEKANQGLVLDRIDGTRFYFRPKEEAVSYFMLSPEKGANSSSWIYYEFIKNGGIRIPHRGTSHLSPNLILKIPSDMYYQKKALYDYYFAYRNYRLFRRLVTNTLLSMIFFLLSVAVLFVDSSFFLSLFYLCVGSLVVGIHNSVEVLRLKKSCRTQGMPVVWQRPKRPGY